MHTSKDKDEQLDPKPMGQLLTGNSLKHLVSKAKQITAADEALQAFLPGDLAAHCHVMNITENALVIKVDSAAWATQLRYLTPDLLIALQRAKMGTLTTIRYRVRP